MVAATPRNNSTRAQTTHRPANGSNSSGYFATEWKLEPSKLAYLDSGTTTAHFPVKKKRRKISETLLLKRQSRLKTVEFLKQLNQENYADSMGRCGVKWSVLGCGQHLISKIPTHRCNIRFCSGCSNRRPARYVKKYHPLAVEFVKLNLSFKPCLLTLTQKKIAGESKKLARARILASFKKLQRRKFFAEYFAGGIWACEITESETGNHAHLHIFIFRRKFIDEKLLKSEWSKVSPGAKNLNIKLINGLEDGLREAIKYIAKPVPAEQLTLESVRQLLELKSLRMIDTFGEFRKFCRDNKIADADDDDVSEVVESAHQEFVVGECCPHLDCEKPLFEQVMTDVDLINYHCRREREREFRE